MRWIVKGAILFFTFVIVNKLLWYVFRVILANYLGPEAYGTFSFAFALLSIFATTAAFGFPLAMERYLAYHKDEIIKRKIIFFALNFVALLSSVLLLLVVFSKIFEGVILLFLLALPFTTILRVIGGVFRAHGKIEYQIICSLLFALMNLIFALLTMFMEFTITFIAIGFVLSYIIALSVSIFFFRKIVEFKAKLPERKLIRKILSFSWPLVTAGILALIIMWTDTLMLGVLESREIVGYYNAAVPIAKLALIFASSLNSLLLPEISKRLANEKQIRRPIEVVYKWNLLLTLTFVLPMILFPGIVIEKIFSPKYTLASLPLCLLSIGMIFNALSQTTSRILGLFEDTRRIMLSNMIAAILNLMLNFYLIQYYSMLGAALASMVSLQVQFFLLLYFARRKMRFTMHSMYAMPLLGIGLATFLLSLFVDFYSLAIYALLVAVYLFSISKEEREYMLDLIRKVSKFP